MEGNILVAALSFQVDVVDKHTMLSCLWDWVLGFEIKRNGQDWDGQLPVEATCLLYQYALQTGIGEEAHVSLKAALMNPKI